MVGPDAPPVECRDLPQMIGASLLPHPVLTQRSASDAQLPAQPRQRAQLDRDTDPIRFAPMTVHEGHVGGHQREEPDQLIRSDRVRKPAQPIEFRLRELSRRHRSPPRQIKTWNDVRCSNAPPDIHQTALLGRASDHSVTRRRAGRRSVIRLCSAGCPGGSGQRLAGGTSRPRTAVTSRRERTSAGVHAGAAKAMR